MEKNIVKVRKSRISTGSHNAVRRGRIHRFAKWCGERYNISWRGIYENFRGVEPKGWKWEGMESCIKQFCPEHEGAPKEFWNSCTKNHFVEFMNSKDISRMTLWKKFDADEWTELELKGIRHMFFFWLENVELKAN